MLFNKIIYLFFLIYFIYCAASVLYLFILSFSGRFFFRKKEGVRQQSLKRRIALLVPAYREDGIILSTANNLLSLDYPADRYSVYIIADSFQQDTLDQLRRLPLTVLEVS